MLEVGPTIQGKYFEGITPEALKKGIILLSYANDLDGQKTPNTENRLVHRVLQMLLTVLPLSAATKPVLMTQNIPGTFATAINTLCGPYASLTYDEMPTHLIKTTTRLLDDIDKNTIPTILYHALNPPTVPSELSSTGEWVSPVKLPDMPLISHPELNTLYDELNVLISDFNAGKPDPEATLGKFFTLLAITWPGIFNLKKENPGSGKLETTLPDPFDQSLVIINNKVESGDKKFSNEEIEQAAISFRNLMELWIKNHILHYVDGSIYAIPKPSIISVTGAPGSGKTTLAMSIKELMNTAPISLIVAEKNNIFTLPGGYQFAMPNTPERTCILLQNPLDKKLVTEPTPPQVDGGDQQHPGIEAYRKVHPEILSNVLLSAASMALMMNAGPCIASIPIQPDLLITAREHPFYEKHTPITNSDNPNVYLNLLSQRISELYDYLDPATQMTLTLILTGQIESGFLDPAMAAELKIRLENNEPLNSSDQRDNRFFNTIYNLVQAKVLDEGEELIEQLTKTLYEIPVHENNNNTLEPLRPSSMQAKVENLAKALSLDNISIDGPGALPSLDSKKIEAWGDEFYLIIQRLREQDATNAEHYQKVFETIRSLLNVIEYQALEREKIQKE
ncbi:MAG: hypothetical protein WCJ58_01450 [bacterium]